MKQTKKLTRNQKEFLSRCKIDDKRINVSEYRLVEDLPDSITVQHVDGHVDTFYK